MAWAQCAQALVHRSAQGSHRSRKIGEGRSGDGDLGQVALDPRAKKVIEYAIDEARSLNHNYVGTEHLLLGLLREQDGVAAQVLMNLGLKLEEVREEVLNLLGASMEDGEDIDADELEEGDEGEAASPEPGVAHALARARPRPWTTLAAISPIWPRRMNSTP